MSVNVDERFAPPQALVEDAALDGRVRSRKCLRDATADTRVIQL
ncbi:hypothetical protein [Roseateles aquatilis]|nr:hypothetical protein [Roseateles aquatilis]